MFFMTDKIRIIQNLILVGCLMTKLLLCQTFRAARFTGELHPMAKQTKTANVIILKPAASTIPLSKQTHAWIFALEGHGSFTLSL